MQASDEDLLVGALALAYKFADLAALRRAYAQAEAGDGDPAGVLAALERERVLSPARTARLRRAAAVAARLRDDAVYGMIALRNRLLGAQVLNACMDEARREGHARALAQILRERGVLGEAQDEAIAGRAAGVLDDVRQKERALQGTIDLARDPPEQAELKLAMLLGEVAGKLSFLQRADLDAAVAAAERRERGLPAEAPAAPPPPPQQADIPIPVAAPAAPGQAPEAADPIKGYELLLKLGQGAMGAVLKARKRDSGEVVALKLLKPELATDREYVERFLREAKAVARLSHPNIIRAVQAGRSGDYYFFAMEFVEGQTASELIKAKGKLPERFGVMVTRCVASALAHAWEHEIIHRDIKPDNVMITKDGGVKLTDLGLARTAKQESTLTMTGVVMGSPAYISPEQGTGEKNLDTRSDIYSLGATLFHMLTGKVPYEGETPLQVMLRHMQDPVPDVKAHAPQVSEATRQLIMTMMAKRPEQRFQSAKHVEQAARAIEDALARGEAPPIIWKRVVRQAPGQPAPGQPAGAQPAQATDAALSASRRAPAAAGKPAAPAAAPAAKAKPVASGRLATSQSGDRKLGQSMSGEKAKEVGERLRRMAQKKKGR